VTKSLKTLIRVARWAVEERQKELSALLDREQQIQAAIDNHHRALENERIVASGDSLGVGRGFENYFGLWRQQLQHFKGLMADVQTQIEAARDELAQAYREQKSIEEVQKQRDIQTALEADRKEQTELDEIGQTQHFLKG
jgi:flagellar export protein FliJ